jgi:hypothetical protein
MSGGVGSSSREQGFHHLTSARFARSMNSAKAADCLTTPARITVSRISTNTIGLEPRSHSGVAKNPSMPGCAVFVRRVKQARKVGPSYRNDIFGYCKARGIMKPHSIFCWYRILRANYHWTMFQAIRYAMWLAR